MRCAFSAVSLGLFALLGAAPVAAFERHFPYTEASRVLAPGASQLSPWTTLRAGRERYYSALDARLELAHGLTPGLELSLAWNFRTQSRDVVADELTGAIERLTSSELASASFGVDYQLADARADLVGAGLAFDATIGPQRSQLSGGFIADRELGAWRVAANLGLACQLESVRDEAGSELEARWLLEPTLAGSYLLPRGFSLGVELRAPLALSGERKPAALFAGPLIGYRARTLWLMLGVQPQLFAFSGRSGASPLALDDHERVEVRLLAGFAL
jgi:hypothetical protein